MFQFMIIKKPHSFKNEVFIYLKRCLFYPKATLLKPVTVKPPSTDFT